MEKSNYYYSKIKSDEQAYKLYLEKARQRYYDNHKNKIEYQRKYNELNKEKYKDKYHNEYSKKMRDKYYCDICGTHNVYKRQYIEHFNTNKHCRNLFKELPLHLM
jgi:hypothetical protein